MDEMQVCAASYSKLVQNVLNFMTQFLVMRHVKVLSCFSSYKDYVCLSEFVFWKVGTCEAS